MDKSVMLTLPRMEEVTQQDRLRLFVLKLRVCQKNYDFNSNTDLAEKEKKKSHLLDLMQYIARDPMILSRPDVYPEIFAMIHENLIRYPPPRINPPDVPYDPDEDEAILEAAWPHIELIYEFFLECLESPSFEISIAAGYLTPRFVSQLLQLFHTEDPRERDLLKTTMHRIYGVFVPLRAHIRREIKNIFLTVLHEGVEHNGLAELLDILGSIINGYMTPLRQEHRDFLCKVLLLLYKDKNYRFFHNQLSFCIVEYLEKDPSLAPVVFDTLLKCWPKGNTPKELLLISVLGELLTVIPQEEFHNVQFKVFKKIASLIASDHFMVCEKVLSLFNNEQIVYLVADNVQVLLPLLFGPLFYNATQHWHKATSAMSGNILKLFMEIDPQLYQKCLSKYMTASDQGLSEENKWNILENIINKKG